MFVLASHLEIYVKMKDNRTIVDGLRNTTVL